MIKLKCCISILWYSSTTFYEKKWNSPKIKEWWRYIHGSFTWLFFYCSWYVVEKAVNTLQLVQCTFVQTRLQRRINYVIHMKTHDGTGHTICIFSPPSKMPQPLKPHPFPYIFKNMCNREKYNKDLSKTDISRTSNEGQKHQTSALHNQQGKTKNCNTVLGWFEVFLLLFHFSKYIEAMGEKKKKPHMPRPKSWCTVSSTTLLLLIIIIIIPFMVWKIISFTCN